MQARDWHPMMVRETSLCVSSSKKGDNPTEAEPNHVQSTNVHAQSENCTTNKSTFKDVVKTPMTHATHCPV